MQSCAFNIFANASMCALDSAFAHICISQITHAHVYFAIYTCMLFQYFQKFKQSFEV